jgi:hypothetical protein
MLYSEKSKTNAFSKYSTPSSKEVAKLPLQLLLFPIYLSYLCPVKLCVQYPPSISQTRADLSAEAVARRAPVESTAISAIGARWPCRDGKQIGKRN